MAKAFLSSLRESRGGRFRLAVVLLALAGTIMAGKFWEGLYVDNLRRDCGSLFQDRLLPTIMLFQLLDEVHARRATLDAHLYHDARERKESLDYALGKHDATIEQLLRQFERTYLVDEESRTLSELRRSLRNYGDAEKAALARSTTGEGRRDDAVLAAAFDEIHGELVQLTRVQETVGNDLKEDSRISAAQVSFLLYFQLGVAFVLGLMASGLALSLSQRQTHESAPKETSHLH